MEDEQFRHLAFARLINHLTGSKPFNNLIVRFSPSNIVICARVRSIPELLKLECDNLITDSIKLPFSPFKMP